MGNISVIKAQGLSRIYRLENGGEVRAVDSVDLQVPKGQFLTVIGASGSGKTTLLNLLGGLDKPTAGRVVVEGVNISNLREAELVKFRRKTVNFVSNAWNSLYPPYIKQAAWTVFHMLLGGFCANRIDPLYRLLHRLTNRRQI